MKVKKSDIMKALEIAGKFVQKGKTALKVTTLALVDAPGQRVVATDLEAFCEVATPSATSRKPWRKRPTWYRSPARIWWVSWKG